MAKNIFGYDDLVNNPSTRLSFGCIPDCSGSMYGTPIRELNDGVRTLFESISNDPVAYGAAEVSIVPINSDPKVHTYFTPVYNMPSAPTFTADGNTFMGEAVNLMLDMFEKRKTEYKLCGISYYQPMMVIMSDGKPNGNKSELQRAMQRTVELVKNNKLTVIPIGIGSDADMVTLAGFSPVYKPMRLKDLNFRDFFKWLSMSISSVVKSRPEDMVSLDLSTITSWGEL